MSIETRSMQYGSIFGQWHIDKLLGTGSAGKSAVFSLYRDNNGWREYSALKVISLIEEIGTESSLSDHAISEYSTAVKELRSQADMEVQLMKQLRGKTNIVDYLDHCFFSWKDDNGFGVDLLIRMEMLTDLRSQMRKGKIYTPEEILDIALGICQGLVLCHGKNILHRDIKPENIFFNQDMDYKLGDFGIARIMADSPSSRASTGIGTIAYSPHEQLQGSYDQRVDIYSLGLVLYELLNGNRLPFAQTSYVSDRDIQIRLSGAPLPEPDLSRLPASDNPDLARKLMLICMKACSFQPQDRFPSAAHMLDALQNISAVMPFSPQNRPGAVPVNRKPTFDSYQTEFSAVAPTPPVTRHVSAPPVSKTPVPPKPYSRSVSEKPKKSLLPLFLVLTLGIVILACAVFLTLRHKHTWEPATCSSARYCLECGEISGSATGHQWLDATCTTAKTCDVCGKTSGVPLGHNWSAATCDAPSSCYRCGVTDGTALEHQWVDATCEYPRNCTLCGKTDGQALGHVSSNPTFRTPAVCSRCNSITAPNIPYQDINVQEAIKPVGDYFDQLMTMIARSQLKPVVQSNGVYAYYDDGGELVMVTVFKKTPGIGSYSSDYTRWYCYMEGEFVYAFYDGEDQHRFSFYDEMLMRWRYRPVLNTSEWDEIEDFTFSRQFLEWEQIVLKEALSFK